MRVIAGMYRSRSLVAPKGDATRPTSDRLRETLFNILEARRPGVGLAGCRFADLYAGTGAVGIEALSRGAAYVWFGERAAPAVAAIRANLKGLRIGRGFSIEERGVGAMLERMLKTAGAGGAGAGGAREGLDVVFLDPPWEAAAEYEATLHLLGSARGGALLAEGALVIAEHSSKVPLAERYGELVKMRMRKQGDAALSFYAVGAD
jgi:16S rRNA (guanine(966)-N(2))-methyltransferase RsmD